MLEKQIVLAYKLSLTAAVGLRVYIWLSYKR